MFNFAKRTYHISTVMPDGSMYASDHEIRLQMEGLEKPRRKRGRPPKMDPKV